MIQSREARHRTDLERALALVRFFRDPAFPGMAFMAALVVAGFVLLGFGWRGVARTYYVVAQLPAFVSGAVAGLALIGTGLTLLVVQISRRDSARELESIDSVLDEAIEAVSATLAIEESRSR